jgi:hypothetical protein
MYHNIIPNDTEKYKWGKSIGLFEILLYYLLIFKLFRNYKVYHIMIHWYHNMIPKSINPKNSFGFFEILLYFIIIFRLFRDNKVYHNIIPKRINIKYPYCMKYFL